ncbi:hypothetical protein [Clostridium sp.]|jgi:hypothetical protein|uniref:hypothetical protein n=1 Tax=Clostridium sp. TaxID=1506 RepID=UPI00290E9D7C|nr:hypothetical protein [Clostridium sp.]MDU7364294.1 hypothetical protein [Clostridium sp.]
MINENNELTITTGEGFEIERIINKLGMKENVVNFINVYIKNEQLKQKETLKLQALIIEKVGGKDNYINLSDEEKAKISDEVLGEHEDIYNALLEIQSSTAKLGVDLMYDFVCKMPNAEKEIYKTLGKIFNKQMKEIENQPLGETVTQIKEIVKSKTFNDLFGFFN